MPASRWQVRLEGVNAHCFGTPSGTERGLPHELRTGLRASDPRASKRTCSRPATSSRVSPAGSLTSPSLGFCPQRADIIHLKGSWRESTPWTVSAGWSLIFRAVRPTRAGVTLVRLTVTSPASSTGSGWPRGWPREGDPHEQETKLDVDRRKSHTLPGRDGVF